MTVDPIASGPEADAGVDRVGRGGYCYSYAQGARAARRFCYSPDDRSGLIGFRLTATCKATTPVVQ